MNTRWAVAFWLLLEELEVISFGRGCYWILCFYNNRVSPAVFVFYCWGWKALLSLLSSCQRLDIEGRCSFSQQIPREQRNGRTDVRGVFREPFLARKGVDREAGGEERRVTGASSLDKACCSCALREPLKILALGCFIRQLYAGQVGMQMAPARGWQSDHKGLDRNILGFVGHSCRRKASIDNT